MLASASAVAQEKQDTVRLGYGLELASKDIAFVQRSVGREVLQNAPEIDLAKALYGRIAGLNVYQGAGVSADNLSALSVHGRAPLVLVDGFPRDIRHLTATEVESVAYLSDAAAMALYGVRGSNGVIMITTRRGTEGQMKIDVGYRTGLNTQFRAPDFADAYRYGNALNEALALDGLQPRYSELELEALRTARFASEYPDVDWWNEVYTPTAQNHRVDFSFDGGNSRFRYFAAVDYMRDRGFFRDNTEEQRYNSQLTDTRLNVLANLDIALTATTKMRLGAKGKIAETNKANFGDFYNILYKTPSAAFPVRYADDGFYGSTNIYGSNNPVALIKDTGNYRNTSSVFQANLALIQNLDFITKGLSAEITIAFDNYGAMYDQSSKKYRYKDAQAQITDDGTLTTKPIFYGSESKVIGHSQAFSWLNISSDLQAKIDYKSDALQAALIYNQQSFIATGRNASHKRQSYIGLVSYTFDKRYAVNAVLNYSGSAFMPVNKAFNLYPAVSLAWIASEEEFMKSVDWINNLKVFASAGMSGWDGNMSHELWRQYYGESYGSHYYFSNNTNDNYGMGEGTLPVEDLKPELVKRVNAGVEAKLFGKLGFYANAFFENRGNMLVSGSSAVSGVLGVAVGQQCAGEQEWKGIDLALDFSDTVGDFSYSLYANANMLTSKIINENQSYQQYDYLYHMGDKVGQYYGLVAEGLFRNQLEINRHETQTFSDVRPGDIMYQDQNGDGLIDDQDVVRMFGSSIPALTCGFGFNLGYKGIELSAAFQGVTGKTVSLLSSPLYKPLVGNGNISDSFLDSEIPWTPENANEATMPRLTTLTNNNNYRTSSFWLRDGSFLKLRNLTLAYTLPKMKFTTMQVYLQGTNLFSLDKLKIFDPEMMGANYPALRSYWLGVKFTF